MRLLLLGAGDSRRVSSRVKTGSKYMEGFVTATKGSLSKAMAKMHNETIPAAALCDTSSSKESNRTLPHRESNAATPTGREASVASVASGGGGGARDAYRVTRSKAFSDSMGVNRSSLFRLGRQPRYGHYIFSSITKHVNVRLVQIYMSVHKSSVHQVIL